MFKFSERSERRMQGLKPELIALLGLALDRTPVDFGIAWMGGFRTVEDQQKLYNKEPRVTTKDGIIRKSKHQSGKAVDIIPYVNGRPAPTTENYLLILGVFFSCASELGLKIRSGANWDSDQEFLTDQTFNDLPHIELR